MDEARLLFDGRSAEVSFSAILGSRDADVIDERRCEAFTAGEDSEDGGGCAILDGVKVLSLNGEMIGLFAGLSRFSIWF